MLTSRQRSSLSLLATVRPVRLVRLTPTRARLNASPNPNPDADPNPNPNPNPAGGLDGRQGDGPDEGSNEDDTSMAAVLPVRHSSELPLAMHAEWLPGHCGTTSEQGAQCRHGDSQGSAAGVRNLSACLVRVRVRVRVRATNPNPNPNPNPNANPNPSGWGALGLGVGMGIEGSKP